MLAELLVALVGPNGAGKTTLLHCAVGLVTPSTGTISVLGGIAPGSPEALARLDPLARHDLMASVMVSAFEESISVLFSSHVVSELERVADYLIVLGHGQVQMVGDIEELLSAHVVFSGPVEHLDRLRGECTIIHAETAGRQAQVIVRLSDTAAPPPGWERAPISLEELVLAYLREPSASVLPGPLRIAANTAEVSS